MSRKPGSQSEGRAAYRYLSLAVVFLVLLLAVAIIYFWKQVEHLEAYGYAGAFVISLLGSATVLVPVPAMAAFPNPFFDLVGTIAGPFRYPLWRFLLLCWAGKTIKGLMVALAGAWGLRFVLRWLELMGF